MQGKGKSMGIQLSSLKRYVQGFRKVPLKDTRGVLTPKNNFKWVKGNTQIMPSGTYVSSSETGKYVFKPDGKTFFTDINPDKSLNITSAQFYKKSEMTVKDDKVYLPDGSDAGITPQRLKDARKSIGLFFQGLNLKRKVLVENFVKGAGKTKSEVK